MISRVKRHISRHITNLAGWHTDRKIVVIESDDWGSIRMPSREVYQQCLQKGYQVDDTAYERFDSLASEEDLQLLFNLLKNYKDYKGNPVVMTANILVANPDFEKIALAGCQDYYYELITETFKRYPNHSRCIEFWKKGKEEGIFFPQSHGREHLNVSMFMNALQQGNPDALFSFKHKMPGCIPKVEPKDGNKFVESLRYTTLQDKEEKLSIVLEGLKLFKSLMGYRSDTLIPPNYLWSPDFDAKISGMGVQFYQGRRKMKEPCFDGSIRLHSHRLGEENEYGQKYLVRNAFFEPTLCNSSEDPVVRCLKDISTAFKMGKPAIICSHRLNYVGFINKKNRDQNLHMLESLLKQILKRWPSVEFLNSAQLGDAISGTR